MFNLKSTFRMKALRLVLVLATVSAATMVTANLFKDPLENEVIKLEKLEDKALLQPKSIELFKTVKNTIENAAVDRMERPLFDRLNTSLVAISARYFVQQRRLYLQYMTQAHTDTTPIKTLYQAGKEKNYFADHFDYLNLELPGSLAYSLSSNKEPKLSLNVWHKGGKADVAVLGLNPQDKDGIEQLAIHSQGTLQSYAKLIQFMSIRERIANHSTIQRLSPAGAVSDPELFACGESLVSFRSPFSSALLQSKIDINGVHPAQATDQKRNDYYRFLKQFESYKVYQKAVDAKILNAALIQSISSGSNLAPVYLKFFNSLPDFEVVRENKQWGDADPLPGLVATEILPNAPSKEEALFLSKLDSALLIANLPADEFERHEEVAARIVNLAFKMKGDILVEQFTTEALSRGFAVYAKNEDQVRRLARSSLEKFLSDVEAPWKKTVQKQVADALVGKSVQEIKAKLHGDYLEEAFANVWPSIRLGTRAIRTSKLAQEKITNETKIAKFGVGEPRTVYTNGVIDGKANYFKGGKDLGLGGLIQTTGLLPADERVYAYKPEQLQLFFNEKLAFWAKANAELSKNAQAIMSNELVMNAIKSFFDQLSKDYYDRMKQKNISGDQLSAIENQDELFKSIDGIAVAAFNTLQQNVDKFKAADSQKFNQMIGDMKAMSAGNKPSYETKSSDAKGTLKKTYKKKNDYDQALVQKDNATTRLPELPRRQMPSGLSKRQMDKEVQKRLKEGPALAVKDQLNHPLPKLEKDGNFSKKREMNKEAPRLFLDAMSVLGLAPVFKPVRTEANKITRFAGLENYLDQKNTVENRRVRSARTLLDQFLMGKITQGMVLSEHPILAIQTANTEKAPNMLDVIYSQSGKSPARADARKKFETTLGFAQQNQKRLVAEACEAKPFIKDDENWRNVFRSSGTLRENMMSLNSNYKNFDESWMKSTRTYWERTLEDVIDPLSQFMFYASLIIMAVMFAPAGLAALGSSITLGTASLGATAALESFATSTILKQLMMVFGGKFMTVVFTVQVALMGYVNCYELPNHLKYQLGVANAQIGIDSQLTTSRDEIRGFAEAMHAKQVGTYIFAGMHFAFVGKMAYSSVKSVTGVKVEQALARHVVSEAGEATANEMKVATLSELTQSKGAFRGTQEWLSQSIRSLRQTGRIMTLNPSASMAQVESLMQERLATMHSDPVLYRNMIEAQIEDLSKTGAKLKQMIIDQTNPGKAQAFKNWLRGNMSNYLLEGKYWNVGISERAINGILRDVDVGTAQMATAITSKNEMHEFLVKAYLMKLYEQRAYWEFRLTVMKSFEGELAIKAGSNEMMHHYFQTFAEQDLMRHQELMNWTIRKTSATSVEAWARKAFGSSAEIREFKRMYRDHFTLANEIAVAKKAAEKQAASAAEAEKEMFFDMDAAGNVTAEPKLLGGQPGAFKVNLEDMAY